MTVVLGQVAQMLSIAVRIFALLLNTEMINQGSFYEGIGQTTTTRFVTFTFAFGSLSQGKLVLVLVYHIL